MKLVMLVAIIAGGALSAPQGLFGGGGAFLGSTDPAADDSGRFDHPFLNVFRTPFFGRSPPFVTNFDDLADDYDNSTSEVKVVNGSRVEVNRTVTKQSGDGGVFITHIHSVRTLPPDGGQEADAVPAEKEQVDDSETSGESEEASFRHPSWLLMKWLSEVLQRSKNDLESHESHLKDLEVSSDRNLYSVGGGGEVGEATEVMQGGVGGPISYHDDLAVNYIEPPAMHPDAEVFDPDLIREDELRFFESRAEPLTSQPIRSQPMMSQPIRSQPIRL